MVTRFRAVLLFIMVGVRVLHQSRAMQPGGDDLLLDDLVLVCSLA